ncbi:hypothetical protein LguiB_023184 [Lonicera macranthoides]
MYRPQEDNARMMSEVEIKVFLPRAFERYFKERNEIHAKTAQDKNSIAAHKTQSPAAADKKAD